MARPIAGRLLSAPLLVCVLLGALSPATLRAEPAAGVSAGLYANMVPDLTYLTPMAAITRGKLYAEGRYQYEDLETGSAWFMCMASPIAITPHWPMCRRTISIL